jgi:hypothetical protein
MVAAGDAEMPEPVWPGLFQPYPEDPHLSPYRAARDQQQRHNDREALA